jgi:hypothetical protein
MTEAHIDGGLVRDVFQRYAVATTGDERPIAQGLPARS